MKGNESCRDKWISEGNQGARYVKGAGEENGSRRIGRDRTKSPDEGRAQVSGEMGGGGLGGKGAQKGRI